MRGRKVAKQFKKYFACAEFVAEDELPSSSYKVGGLMDKISYLERMTRKSYFGLIRKSKGDLKKLYIHKAADESLFEEILNYWNIW